MTSHRSLRVVALAVLLAAGVVALTAAGPGSGTATISPSSSVAAGSSGSWDIVYTAAETHDDGTVRITIPAGWTAPQDGSSTSPGFVTVITDEPTGNPSLFIAGQVITVAVDTLNAGNTITIVYGDDTASASGRASAAQTVGTYPFLVASDPAGGSPSNLAASPSLTVIPTTPASLDIVPNDTTGVDAGTFVQLHIRVLDTFGNRAPVATNRTVNLFATHGQFYDPSNHSTPISSAVIASGTNVKRVDYRPTLVAGSPHTLNIFTASGSPSLGGTTTVAVVPAVLSVSQSTISATSPVTADGSDQSSVVVTSRDAFGNPRAGDTVTIDATGSATDVDPGSTTNASGQATGAVANTVAEIVTVSATINGQAVTSGNPSVSFVAGPVSATESTLQATTPVVANGIATSTITITARDAFNNVVAGQSVTLFVSPTANATLTQPGGVTGPTGEVTGTLSSTVVGDRTVTANIGATPVVDDAVVQFIAGGVANFVVTVDGNAVAGTVEPVTITARDAQNNVVTNYTGTVNLTTTSGVANSVEWALGDGQGTINNVPGSDDGSYTFAAADNGIATIRVIDERVETIQLTATAGAASGTSGNLAIVNNIADKIELISGNAQSATVNSPVPSAPTVRVLDAFNNPVPSAPVTFTAVGGGGTVDAISGGGVDSTVTTAGDGRIDCDIWRMGTIAGLNRLRARIALGTITSVDFTATGTPGAGANLDIAPNSKSVTQGAFEVVTATLTDAFGNAKSGERVDIVIKSGLNGTLSEDPVDPGTTTALNPQARFGNTDAAGRVTVRWNAPGGAGLADVLDASTASVPQASVVDATYTTVASGATNLRITFVGPSTRPANQNIEFVVEAVDGNGNVDTGNTSTVALAPEAGGNVTFSLDPGFGSTITDAQLVAGARTIYARGTVAGDWDITTSTGGLGPDTEVVTITDTGTIDHYLVTTVTNVVAGVLFDVAVEAQDAFNNRVLGANNSVALQAIDDQNDVPAQSTLLVQNATLASGRVTVAETYTKAEAIRVKASASGNEGISNIVTVAAAPAYRIAKVSGDNTGIIAGANQVLTALVLDPFDNPVNNALVTFTELEGNGTPTPPSANTNPTGQVSTTYTTGTTVGSNRIKAAISDENPPSLERVEYLVTTIPGPVASFQVTPASFSLMAGASVALNVTGFDANGNLVSNDDTTPIQLTNTGSATFGAATGTLTDGVFNTTVTDQVAETFTITATRQGGGASGTSGVVTVTNAAAYLVTKVGVDPSGVPAGTAVPLEVLVRDQFNNAVPGALVTFATTGVINDGSFTDTVGDPDDGITTTDGTGHAVVTFTTSVTAGANNVNATILDGNPTIRERVTFTVNTVAGGIAYYTVQMSGTTVTAGQTRNVTVTAFDSSNNPVDDDVTQVTLSGDPGVGLVFGVNPVTLTNGVATTTVRADQVQTYRVRAGALPGPTGLGEQVTVTPANPAGTITATPNPATITANGVSISDITSSVIRDAFGNQVPAGTMINVTTNNGAIVPVGAKAVLANGTINFDLRSSTTPGTATVTMTSQVGTATGTVNVTFAPPPVFATTNPPLSPSIVAPGESHSFSVGVQNTSTTDANLTTATYITFSDGVRTFIANLSSATTITGPGNQTLVFVATTVNAAFTSGQYDPDVVLIGTDEFGAAINSTISTPTNALLITSIEITAIAPPPVVIPGQARTVVVSVRNKGAQDTEITDIDLNFTPPGVFTPGTITPQTLGPGATGQFSVSVVIEVSCPIGTYTIDAVATGDVGGKTVTDNSIAPFTAPTWQVVTAANLSYVSGTLSPMSVSRGDAYQFRATFENEGAGVVTLDSSLTTIRITDGIRIYQSKPIQPYAIASGAQQQLIFKTRAVANAFTPGSYVATFNLQGLDSGAPFQQAETSGADLVAVQTPANVGSGSVTPDLVTKGSSVPFTVQVTNGGGASVVLTPASTEFRFAGGLFSADLDPNAVTTIPPGGTTLTFLATAVSQAITAGPYAGQLALVGTENGNPFSSTLATEIVTVENAPNLQISATIPSLTSFTTDQTRPFKVRMVVANNNGATVTFTDASLKFIHGGNDRTSQFTISTPTNFVSGTSLTSGEVDTVLFDVSDNTGNAMTPGMMTIQGELEVEDINTQNPIFAENDLGGFLQVQTPATISVLSVLPSQSTVTQSMTKDFIVRAVVQNQGQSEVVLQLASPTTLVWGSPPGWNWTVRTALGNGSNVLSGGEIDTVLFDVRDSGSTTGVTSLDATIRGTETNSNRTFNGASSGAASVLVQSAGDVDVVSVVSSRSTITNGANVPWTLTVTLENPGQSDINLAALASNITVTFEGAAPAPSYNVPSTLAGGGTILSGGETDQLVFTVNSAGTYGTPGPKNITVDADGVEINSGVVRNDSDFDVVTVQQVPVLDFVSLTPSPVSRGSSVAFNVTIRNNAVNGATATLDRGTTRLRFGGGQFNVNLQPASPVDVAAGAQVTLLFTSATVVPGIPLGNQTAFLDFSWTDNGRSGTETESLPGNAIEVEAAPDLSIVSVRSSRSTVTTGQTNPWTITMVVQNTNGAGVDLDLSPALTRLQLNVLGSGANVTTEYTIQSPTALEASGNEILAGGAIDSLIFDVSVAGNTAGTIIVSGFVRGIDLNSGDPVFDDTVSGGAGSFILQTLGVLNILSTTTRPTATALQTAPYPIKVAVRNDGQAAIDLDLSTPTATAVTFSAPAGWATNVQTTLVGGGVRLSGGETDTVVFNVTTTGSVATTQTISGNVVGNEFNTGAPRSDNTASGGTGSILVQSEALIVISSATPVPATLTSGASTPWDVTISIQNTGQSAARLLLPAGLTVTVQSTAPPASFNPVNNLQEGGVVLAGGATGTLVAHANASPTFTAFGTRSIGVALSAVEINSNRALNPSDATAGTVNAQTVPNLTAALVSPPVLVTRGAQAFLQVEVTNPGVNAATVVLDRATTRVSFGGALYNAFLDASSPNVMVGGQTITLSFEDKLVQPGLPLGSHDLNVNLDYTANGIPGSELEVITNGITVQDPPQFRITGISASVSDVTAGQTQNWSATMTIVNEGSADVDLSLLANKTYVRFLAPGGAVDGTYVILQPTELVNGGTRLEVGSTDQLVFTIDRTGDVPGFMVISGRVEGTDVIQQVVVFDDTFDGGRGNVNVQPAAAIAITSTRPSQTELTAGQNGWGVRVVLANTGGSAVDIDLNNARVEFDGSRAGWTFGSVTLIGGGNRLQGGTVDSLLFQVLTTTTVPGTKRIDAFVPYVEVNTQLVDSVTTTPSGNFGQVKVETRPRLRITTAVVNAPNPTAVNLNQPFDVRVQVQNLGEADARDVAIGMTTNGSSTIQLPIPPITEVTGGQTLTYDMPVQAAGAPNGSERFSTDITSARDENSGQPSLVTLSANQDSMETIAIQTPADFDITNVRPSQTTVTRSQTQDWNVIVRVQNTGGAGAVLAAPAANDLGFSIAGSVKTGYVVQPPTAFGSGRPGWTLAGNDADSLIYTVSVTGPDTGLVDVGVVNDGTDRNDPTLAFSDTDTTNVRVQLPAGFAISNTVPFGTVNHANADRDTVNTLQQYEIHVTVANTGEAVDSVLVTLNRDGASTVQPKSLRRRQINVDGSHTFEFRITSPGAPDNLETFTASILPGSRSRNTGQLISPQPPLDNRHVVVIQRPANLVMNLTSASGAVSANQVFTMSATVTNPGPNQAGVAGTARLTLTVPPNFTHLNPGGNEPLVRDFVVGTPVTWQIQAPPAPQASDNFASTISTFPNDRNIGTAAASSQPSDQFGVAVVAGGAFSTPVIAIDSPAGAVDATVSATQHFFVDATVTATQTTNNVVATLSIPGGYQIVGQSTRSLGDGTGNPMSVPQNDLFEVIAPASPGAGNLFVTFTGIDQNTLQPVPTAADTVTVTTVPRAALTTTASVTAPPAATDNTVTIGTEFTATAQVANAPGAAGIASPGTLTIVLPTGYTLAGGETAAKPFTIAAPVSWQVVAPPQPAGPQQINVNISTVPPDENSGTAATVLDGTGTIAMVTEGSAVAVRDVSPSLGINVGPVPAGTSNIEMLGFEIAFNVSDINVAPARIDTIAVTIVGADGTPLGPSAVAQTLSQLSIDVAGTTPVAVVVNDPATNPVVVSFTSSPAGDRNIAPDGVRNAVVSVSLDANPAATEFSVGLRTGALKVRDSQSNQLLGVTDSNGQPLDGVITSDPLVILSSQFAEYVHNYPNPFRAGSQDTRIAYFMQSPGNVSVRVFAIDGNLVYEENIPGSDSRAQVGPQETTWDGRNGKGEVVRNGIYVCVVNAGGQSAKFRIAVAK
jgi:hypothetical protein